MSHDEATEVKRLNKLSSDLDAVYSMKAASTPELTQRVLDELLAPRALAAARGGRWRYSQRQ